MFDQKFLPYLNVITNVVLPSELRTPLVAAAVASAIANEIEVPVNKVAGPESHFNATFAVQARSLIGQFNNAAPLDYDRTCSLVRKFWLVRYLAVHNESPPLFVKGKFAESFFGLNYVFSKEELELFNEQAEVFGQIRQIVANILPLLKD